MKHKDHITYETPKFIRYLTSGELYSFDNINDLKGFILLGNKDLKKVDCLGLFDYNILKSNCKNDENWKYGHIMYIETIDCLVNTGFSKGIDKDNVSLKTFYKFLYGSQIVYIHVDNFEKSLNNRTVRKVD